MTDQPDPSEPVDAAENANAAENAENAEAPETQIDATSIVGVGLPRRMLKRIDGQRKHGFQVVMRRPAMDTMLQHARSRTDVEVCGILAGNLYRDHFGPYLLISAALPGHAASQRGASVTFTAETWTSVTEQMEKDHADRRMAGWYHTHPDFGVFLSDADVFIHRNFFDLPWQPAIVVDPVRHETGNFVWREGEPVREPLLIEEENITTDWKKIHENGGESPGFFRGIRRFLANVLPPILFMLLLAALAGATWLGLHYLEF